MEKVVSFCVVLARSFSLVYHGSLFRFVVVLYSPVAVALAGATNLLTSVSDALPPVTAQAVTDLSPATAFAVAEEQAP